jgi:hypothetical protein
MSCCSNPVSPPPLPVPPTCEPLAAVLSTCASASNSAFRKLPKSCKKLAGAAEGPVELAVGAVAPAAPDADAAALGALVDPVVLATAADAGALAAAVVEVTFAAAVGEGVEELLVPPEPLAGEGVEEAVPVEAAAVLAASLVPPLPEAKSPMSVCNKLRNSAAIGSLPALLAAPPASQGSPQLPEPGTCALEIVLLAALDADPELELEMDPEEPLLSFRCSGCHQLKPVIPPMPDMPCSLAQSRVSKTCSRAISDAGVI